MIEYPKVTKEWLLARVRSMECGCMVWAAHSQNGQPKTNLGPRSGRKPLNVRRLVWVSSGRELLEGHELICTCGTENCVAVNHLRQVTRAERMKLQYGGKKRNPAHVAKAVLVRRAQSKLKDDAIARIRESNEPTKEIAAREGCSAAYVCMIRAGQCRNELITSPFAGLGARA